MNKMIWKPITDKPQDFKNYLVCWLQKDNGKYSSPHRAYYVEEEGNFFSSENNNSHPILADIYLEIPEISINQSYNNLESLIEILEKIKTDGQGDLSIPKALYLLSLEIQKIKSENSL